MSNVSRFNLPDMQPRTVEFLTDAVGGTRLSGRPEDWIGGVTTDSRAVKPGELFVALRGDRFDGHAFLHQALERGAQGLMVERERWLCGPDSGRVVIEVDDTRRALGRLAAAYRADFGMPIVGVAGSNGKTTTKDLLGSVLERWGTVVVSEASFNNDIGVPLTLLRLHTGCRAAVLELGTNHPGELAPLVMMARPRLGVIPSLGREHLEFFGDLDGVLEEEGWLAELLPSDGALFIHADGPDIEPLVRRTAARVIRVGLREGNDWSAVNVEVGLEGTRFEVRGPTPAYEGIYSIRLLGRHQVTNALLAIAVGAECGLTRQDIAEGLAACRPPKLRLEVRRIGGMTVLDDAYNANADSMVAALRTLCDLPCAGRRVAVLGDMAELGQAAERDHAEVARQAAAMGVQVLHAVGEWAELMVSEARAAGLDQGVAHPDAEAVVHRLRRESRPGDLILIKASRRTQLERVGEGLATVMEGGFEM